jgi:four helix bundle protein
MAIYKRHTELPVYQAGFDAAKEVFRLSKGFPKEEMYSLTDQIRRSSRSVCANVAEAWRERRSETFFTSTLNIAEAEAAETQVWLQFAVDCEYITSDQARPLYKQCDEILAQIVHLIQNPEPWILPKKQKEKKKKGGKRKAKKQMGNDESGIEKAREP